MTFYAKNKRTPPPPRRGTVHSRLRLIGLLLATAAIALLLAGCPPPGGGDTTPTTGGSGGGGGTAGKPGGEGGGTKPPGTTTPPPGGEVSKPAVFTTTVTGSVQDKTFGTGLPGVKVSALTVLVNPENKPAASDSDGNFTLQVKHSGTFKLALENTACYEDLTTADISASADGSHDAGAIGLTAKPEPTGANRYTFTPKGPAAAKKFKLTVNCVREISNNEFNPTGTIIRNKAFAEGVITAAASTASADIGKLRGMITEISLPPTLTKVGNNAFDRHILMSGTLTIPRNVETIGNSAFEGLGFNSSTKPIVDFESSARLKTIGDSAFQVSRLRDFSLPENLETIGQWAFSGAGFDFSSTVTPTLIIPAKVSKIGNEAFGVLTASDNGIRVVEIRSNALAKPPGASAPFPLGNDLFKNVTRITEIILPQAVHGSYTAAERTTIFGSGNISKLKPR